MKVKVKVKHIPTTQVEYYLNQALAETQADLNQALAEQERLYQKNKDLERNLVWAEQDLQYLKQKVSDVSVERDKMVAAYEQVYTALDKALKKLTATFEPIFAET